MFAYCMNNPIVFSDITGALPTYATMMTDKAAASDEVKLWYKLMQEASDAGITLYYSAEAAVASWGGESRSLSQEHEHATAVYRYDTGMGMYYYTGKTYKGTKEVSVNNGKTELIQPNVIAPLMCISINNKAGITPLSHSTLVATAHTHPYPGTNYHNDFPSADANIHGGDRIFYNLLGLPEMYIVPVKLCPGTIPVIKYSDQSTWCADHPYQ